MMHPHQNTIDLCNVALESVRSQISGDHYQSAHRDINQFNECGLGMEYLIDWLTELEVKISPDQFTKIEKAMNAMGLGQSDRMEYLRRSIL